MLTASYYAASSHDISLRRHYATFHAFITLISRLSFRHLRRFLLHAFDIIAYHCHPDISATPPPFIHDMPTFIANTPHTCCLRYYVISRHFLH